MRGWARDPIGSALNAAILSKLKRGGDEQKWMEDGPVTTPVRFEKLRENRVAEFEDQIQGVAAASGGHQ